MGLAFGKVDVEMPNYEVIHKFPTFEVRRYPPAVAATVKYEGDDRTDAPFRILASYIGVFGTPQNRSPNTLPAPQAIAMTAPVLLAADKQNQPPAPQAIAMTAPVLLTNDDANNADQPEAKEQVTQAPQPIAMTAPVILAVGEPQAAATQEVDIDDAGGDGGKKGQQQQAGSSSLASTRDDNREMSFLLPSQFTIASAPVPTDERVRIHEVPSRDVAVLTFAGFGSAATQRLKAAELAAAVLEEAKQLPTLVAAADKQWQCAKYNPPFTLPFLRTNEIHLPLASPAAAAGPPAAAAAAATTTPPTEDSVETKAAAAVEPPCSA